MPLKLQKPRKGKSPNYTIRGTYLGVFVNDRSAGTSQRALAQKELAKVQRDIESRRWDDRGPTFSQAATAYMKAGGERTYIAKLVRHFGDKPISEIDQAAIDTAAAELYPTGTAANRNRAVYTPCSAVLSQAGRSLHLRRPRGGGGNKTTAWLWPEQAAALIKEAHELDPNFSCLLIVLLYTGMRLSEALGLTWNDVRLEDGFAYVAETKNDDPRAVFLPPVAVAALTARNGRKTKRSRQVFPFVKGGHIYNLLRDSAAAASVELPERSSFHILRHTYATWMMRAGLNTRQLVGTGAWKDMKSAARYAHTVTSDEAKRAVNLPVVWGGETVESSIPHEGDIDKSNA